MTTNILIILLVIQVLLFFAMVLFICYERYWKHDKPTALTTEMFLLNGYTEEPTELTPDARMLISPDGRVRVCVEKMYVTPDGRNIWDNPNRIVLFKRELHITVQILTEGGMPFVSMAIDTLEHLNILFETYGIAPLKY